MYKLSNYRPISSATVISKLFESVMLEVCKDRIETSDNQFAYKNAHGTEMAIFSLKHCISLYNSRGTPLYACFMDMSKAFDKVCHDQLFTILVNKGVPYLCLLLTLYELGIAPKS